MPTASREIFKDDQPLFQGTHKGVDGSDSLYDPGAMFKELGCDPSLSLYIENTTQGTSSNVTGSTSDSVYTDSGGGKFPYTLPITFGIGWDKGDTYKIYRTDTKNSFLAGQWCDVSRGWRIYPGDDIAENGWRREDYDLDEPNRRKVFGPGQPE